MTKILYKCRSADWKYAVTGADKSGEKTGFKSKGAGEIGIFKPGWICERPCCESDD